MKTISWHALFCCYSLIMFWDKIACVLLKLLRAGPSVGPYFVWHGWCNFAIRISRIRGVVANYLATQGGGDPRIDSHQHQKDSRHIWRHLRRHLRTDTVFSCNLRCLLIFLHGRSPILPCSWPACWAGGSYWQPDTYLKFYRLRLYTQVSSAAAHIKKRLLGGSVNRKLTPNTSPSAEPIFIIIIYIT